MVSFILPGNKVTLRMLFLVAKLLFFFDGNKHLNHIFITLACKPLRFTGSQREAR